MGKKCLFNILLMFLCLSIPAQRKPVYEHGYLVKIGDMAPDFTIREAGGRTYRLSDLRGKVVMLQFTASWCGVCRKDNFSYASF